MCNVQGNDNPPHGGDEKKKREQFPVDVKIVKAISFEVNDGRGDLVRLVIMNDRATQRYASYREYHSGQGCLPLDDVSSFTMRSRTIEDSQEAIDAFLGSASEPMEVPQIVSFCRGIHSPSGARCRLYKAIDPDDDTRMMGVFIEQDAQGNLERITWYKTWYASSAFHSTPERLEFTLVRSDNGAPSLDLNDIGGWTWHYSTYFGVGLSSQEVKA